MLNRSKRRRIKNLKHTEDCLAVCAYCEKIRVKGNTENEYSWTEVESYRVNKNGIKFTHGICPDCASKLFPELLGEIP